MHLDTFLFSHGRTALACIAASALLLTGFEARADKDTPRSYVSLIADASLRKGFVSGNGASGSGALGVDLQVPEFGLFFVGQASASNSLSGTRKQLASSVFAPGIGAGAGVLDVRITPLGRSRRASVFIRGLSLRLEGSVTGFDWETTLDDGSAIKTETIYNIAFGAMLSYRLDIVGIAMDNGVRIERDQNIIFSLDAGFTGRYIAGDIVSFGRIMSPDAFAAGESVPLAFLAPSARIELTVNHARFFIESPFFVSRGIPELTGLSIFVGGGVRGDVYSIYDSKN